MSFFLWIEPRRRPDSGATEGTGRADAIVDAIVDATVDATVDAITILPLWESHRFPFDTSVFRPG